ncbi:anthranilate synthase/aminodeoxychorismate synthase-like glutamine amidotransferase [Bradyrhizobium sp. USDA 4341]
MILAGDLFQANIAQRFTARLSTIFDPLTFYRQLRSLNPAPFGALLRYGRLTIASSSPERFLKLDGTRVETRPIKGTIARSSDSNEDQRRAQMPVASEKDRAENIMIVDLVRNDLSRVCTPHSVDFPALCDLESYASVHHLVSVVTGQLAGDEDAVTLLRACFPGGSIAGAPKVRSMQIITEIERVAREVYCGAIGFIGFNGQMDTNIAIRTVTIDDDMAVFHAGSGITAMSDPAAEYEETLAKAQRIFDAFRAETCGAHFNIARYFHKLGEATEVFRNDVVSVSDLIDLKPRAVVISPGPCTPMEAGVSTTVVRELSGRIPILGICLGHQCIGSIFGGRVARARRPMHGRSSYITHDAEDYSRTSRPQFALVATILLSLSSMSHAHRILRLPRVPTRARSWRSHIGMNQPMACSSIRNRYLPETGTGCLETSCESRRLTRRSRQWQQSNLVTWNWAPLSRRTNHNRRTAFCGVHPLHPERRPPCRAKRNIESVDRE